MCGWLLNLHLYTLQMDVTLLKKLYNKLIHSFGHSFLVCAMKILYICQICRVGQNRIFTLYMTVCMVISLPKLPYIHRIYVYMHGFGQPYKTLTAWRQR